MSIDTFSNNNQLNFGTIIKPYIYFLMSLDKITKVVFDVKCLLAFVTKVNINKAGASENSDQRFGRPCQRWGF